MKRLTTLFVASLLLALAVTQSAATKNPRGHHHRGHHQQHAVFVQTNEPAGNRIIVFDHQEAHPYSMTARSHDLTRSLPILSLTLGRR